MGKRKYTGVFISITLLIIFIAGCKKNNPTTPVITPPVITGISPLSGLLNSAVTLTGTGFNTNDTVKFDGIQAIINSVTATQMVVTVPSTSTSSRITVYSHGTAMTYPSIFTIISVTKTMLPATFGTFSGTAIANIAVDAAGNIYGNTNKDTVYKITPSGVKNLFAIAGANSTILSGTTVDAAGNIYTVGENDFKIYKITSAGIVSVFAGSGISGFTDGQGTAAQFTAPVGIAADASGNLYVTDVYRIRKITPAGLVSTFAGSAAAGNADGQGTAATFGAHGNLMNITADAAGNLYVSEGYLSVYSIVITNTYYIRKITPAGVVTTTMGPIPGTIIIYPQGGSLYTSLLAVDAGGNFFIPGTYYSTYTNAGGSSFYGPVFMVNKGGYSTSFFDIDYSAAFTSMGYTGITFDTSGNMYVSAAIVDNPAAINPPPPPNFPGKPTPSPTAGSMIIKFAFK